MQLSYAEIKELLSEDDFFLRSPDYLFSIAENIEHLINDNIREFYNATDQFVDGEMYYVNKEFNDIFTDIKARMTGNDSPPSTELKDAIQKQFSLLDSFIQKNTMHTMNEQAWFLSRMKAIGYQIDSRGMCFGMAHMSMQAFLANDMKTFNERLKNIYEMPVNEFHCDFSELRKQQQQLITEGRTDDAADINSKIVNILAFFDGIALYQQTEIYQEMFSQKVELQDAQATMPITMPLALDTEDKKPAMIRDVSDTYDKEKLLNYLTNLQEKLGEHSFALTLGLWPFNGKNGHIINLNYVSETQQWLLIDPNHLPGKEYTDVDLLSDTLLSALPGHEAPTMSITSSIYTTHTHAETMGKHFDDNIRLFLPNYYKEQISNAVKNNDFILAEQLLSREMTHLSGDSIENLKLSLVNWFFCIVASYYQQPILNAVENNDFILAEQLLSRAMTHLSGDSTYAVDLKLLIVERAFKSGQIELITRLIHDDAPLCKKLSNTLDDKIYLLSSDLQSELISKSSKTFFSMINQTNDLLKLLDGGLSEELHPMLVSLVSNQQMASLIPTVNSLVSVLYVLSPAGRAALISSHADYLESISTVITKPLTPKQEERMRLFVQELNSWRLKQQDQPESHTYPVSGNKETQLNMKQVLAELKSATAEKEETSLLQNKK